MKKLEISSAPRGAGQRLHPGPCSRLFVRDEINRRDAIQFGKEGK
jgi:hypothetical protein